jgi:hypothetical protein
MSEWVQMAADMLGDPELTSTLRWRHITRTENASTGGVTETPVEQSFRGAMVEPVRTRMFSESTLARSTTGVLLRPQSFASWVPEILDQVEVEAGKWLRVVDIKKVTAPGGAGLPVQVIWIAALGAA